jgi:hypothetical protein
MDPMNNLKTASALCLLISLGQVSFAKTPIRIDINLEAKDRSYLEPKYKTVYTGTKMTGQQVKEGPSAYVFTNPKISVNGKALSEAELNTRGNQCLAAPRRCFSIKSETVTNFPGTSNLKAKSFNLVSMWQDEGYITAETGYGMYKELGLFHLEREYAEVFVDGKTNGLYLLTEKADKVLQDKFKAAFVGRVKYFSKLEIKEFEADKAKFKEEDYASTFKEIMKADDELPGSELYQYLKERMNIDNYLRLMAANSISMNGDYIDEVYFYSSKEDKKSQVYFDVMAWDLDDLFKAPHPGPWNNLLFKKELANSTLYSLESKLDRVINRNPDLYERYKKTLKAMLINEYTNNFIDKHINRVKTKIAPYLKPEILAQSVRDDRADQPAYTKEYILKLLEQRRAELKARRVVLLQKL